MSEPTTIKMWRAVRVTPSKFPQTLDDCDDGRLVVVRWDGDELIIRKRVGKNALNSDGLIRGAPSIYSFVRYLDDPQPTTQPVPKTFADLNDWQCFRLDGDTRLHWRLGMLRVFLSPLGGISSCSIADDCPIIFINDIEMSLEEQPCN